MSIVINHHPKGDMIKFNQTKVKRFVQSKTLPSIATANGEIFPVDDVGFVFYGVRWEIESYPSEEDIEAARQIMLDVRMGPPRQGCSKRLSLNEIKTKLEDKMGIPYVTNGAMILAASRLRWKIEQEDINGIVLVCRNWWFSLG
jgi:hypothetical protein